MPVSLRLEDALKSFGVPAGRYRIVSSEWVVHRFQSKDGKEFEPFVAWAIGYLPIDEKGAAIGEVEISYDLKVAPGFEEPIDKAKFAPALTPRNPLPLRIGSKGPYLEATGTQTQLAEKSKPMLYLKELYKCGFAVERLVAADFNVGLLVGTEGEIGEFVSKNEGTDAKGVTMKDTRMPAFTKLYKMGYEVQGHPGAAPAVSAVPQLVNGAASPNGSGGDEGAKLAMEILIILATEHKGKGITKLARADAVKLVAAKWSKMGPNAQAPYHRDKRPDAAYRDAAKALIASDDFYELDDVLRIAIPDGDMLEFQ